MNWSAIGAGLLAVAVAAGAFGAHTLRGRLDAYSMNVYEKAVFYHFVHALGLLAISAFVRLDMISSAGATRVGILLLVGIVVFSGSLYALAISGVRMLGAVTPFGGVAFIAAWALLAFELARR
jgi:uncharacterized membrane protein YgdD (TMEM256/DUF423 family)